MSEADWVQALSSGEQRLAEARARVAKECAVLEAQLVTPVQESVTNAVVGLHGAGWSFARIAKTAGWGSRQKAYRVWLAATGGQSGAEVGAEVAEALGWPPLAGDLLVRKGHDWVVVWPRNVDVAVVSAWRDSKVAALVEAARVDPDGVLFGRLFDEESAWPYVRGWLSGEAGVAAPVSVGAARLVPGRPFGEREGFDMWLQLFEAGPFPAFMTLWEVGSSSAVVPPVERRFTPELAGWLLLVWLWLVDDGFRVQLDDMPVFG